MAGESIQPVGVNIKPWPLKWSSVLQTAIENTIRLNNSFKSALTLAPF